MIVVIICTSTIQAQPYGDYTFYSPKTGGKAYLVDMSGNYLPYLDLRSNKPTGYSSYLLPGGVVLRTVAKIRELFHRRSDLRRSTKSGLEWQCHLGLCLFDQGILFASRHPPHAQRQCAADRL